jgi:hypothetical protein
MVLRGKIEMRKMRNQRPNKLFVLIIVVILLAVLLPTINNADAEWSVDDEIFIDDDFIFGSYTPGTFILNTTWGQGGIYAMKSPLINTSNSSSDPTNHWRVGCWSTAIGQIINYHQLQSKGNCMYWCSVLTNSLGFPLFIANNLDDHTYYWYNMATSISAVSPAAEIENVTQLLYDVSTVIQKDFGTGGYVFGSTGRTNEVKEHFEYISSDTEFAINPPISEIISEINHERPCMLYIDNITGLLGHAVALDGYRWSNGKFQVHLNMGWGGGWNNWYVYNETINASGYVFNGTLRGLMFIRLTPNIPITPMGPGLVSPGTMAYMNTSTTSHRDLPLYYKWDWGDGTYSSWMGRYDSGELCDVSHSWSAEGTYDVRVRAMTIKGDMSDWSRPLTVTVFSRLDRYVELLKNKLTELKPVDPPIDKELDKAISHLDDSLNSKFWRDGKHLDEKHGHRVFSEHKAAIKKLQEVTSHKDVPDDVEDSCDDLISKIVSADKFISKVALDDATSSNEEKGKQEQHHGYMAEEEYDDGVEQAAAGESEKAVDEFRKSWEHSGKG